MTDELVKRYDVYPAYHGVDVEECHVGEFVYYADHAARIEQLVATNKQLTAERDKYESAWMTAEGRLADTEAERDRLREALWVILACETPNANATVTRMASIAKAALKGETP